MSSTTPTSSAPSSTATFVYSTAKPPHITSGDWIGIVLGPALFITLCIIINQERKANKLTKLNKWAPRIFPEHIWCPRSNLQHMHNEAKPSTEIELESQRHASESKNLPGYSEETTPPDYAGEPARPDATYSRTT